jgi:hypothetical protein
MREQRLNPRNFVVVMGMAGSLLAGACSGDLASPAAPDAAVTGASAAQSGATQVLPLTALVGTGAGRFNLIHTASDRLFTGDAQLTISVHDVSPNTVLYVQRAGDIGLAGGQQADGVCQRAAGGMFGPVIGADGQAATLETSAGGAGAMHMHLGGPTPDGTSVDAVYRLVDALPPSVPTVDLRTPCFTLTVR